MYTWCVRFKMERFDGGSDIFLFFRCLMIHSDTWRSASSSVSAMLGGLLRDGAGTQAMSPDIGAKIMVSYVEMSPSEHARKWDPRGATGPEFMVTLHLSGGGGNPEGDLSFIPHGRIGGGTYGNVYKAVAIDKNKSVVPVVVKLTKSPKTEPPHEFISEVVTMWDNSSDPNCEIYATCLYGVFKSNFGVALPGHYFYGIVMENMDGDLHSLALSMGKNPKNTPESKFYFLIYCGLHMLYDVWRLHANGYFHNDVKPSNFLYKRMDGGNKYRIKLADFGLSCCKIDHNIGERLSTTQKGKPVITPDLYLSHLPCRAIGTAAYMSDEMKKCQFDYGKRVEICDYDIFRRNDIYAIMVSMKYLASWLGLSEDGVDLSSYDGTPVSESLFTNRDDLIDIIGSYNKAILYFESRKVKMPEEVPVKRPGELSQFTNQLQLHLSGSTELQT